MTNEIIARHFVRLANLMEIRGDDHFRIRSYRNAAETIHDWPTSLTLIYKESGVSGLQQLPGVGKAISNKIAEILNKGTFDAWQKLILTIPESILDLLEIDGVSTRIAATLYQQFKVSTVDDLREFAAGGGLELIDGLSPSTLKRINLSLSTGSALN